MEERFAQTIMINIEMNMIICQAIWHKFINQKSIQILKPGLHNLVEGNCFAFQEIAQAWKLPAYGKLKACFRKDVWVQNSKTKFFALQKFCLMALNDN